MYFNERFSFVGHLFQQRFGSTLIESENYYEEALRYIAFNPVKAGLCEHPGRVAVEQLLRPERAALRSIRSALRDRSGV